MWKKSGSRNTSTGIRVLLLAFAALLLALPGSAMAATIDVNTPADEFDDVTPPGAGCSLREAIEAANTDGTYGGCDAGANENLDTIELDNDVLYPRIQIGDAEHMNATGDFDIRSEDLEITAPGPLGAEVRGIFGNSNGDRVFEVRDPVTVTLSRFAIASGDTAAEAGAILNDTGTLNLSEMHVEVNHADLWGGGIVNNSGTVNITNSTINANHANGDGGGLHNGVGTMNLNNVTVYANQSNFDNTMGGAGGGIFRFGGAVNIANTLIAVNTQPTFPFPSPDCANLAGNLTSLGNNVVASTTGCNWVAASGDVTNTFDEGLDLVGGVQDNGGPTETIGLKPDGLAVDGGNTATCASTDQRGVARPLGNACDIGAFESPFTRTIGGGPGAGGGAGAGGGSGGPGSGGACVKKKKKKKRKRSAVSAKKKKKKKGCGKKKKRKRS